jgi:hypothetical protein
MYMHAAPMGRRTAKWPRTMMVEMQRIASSPEGHVMIDICERVDVVCNDQYGFDRECGAVEKSEGGESQRSVSRGHGIALA